MKEKEKEKEKAKAKDRSVTTTGGRGDHDLEVGLDGKGNGPWKGDERRATRARSRQVTNCLRSYIRYIYIYTDIQPAVPILPYPRPRPFSLLPTSSHSFQHPTPTLTPRPTHPSPRPRTHVSSLVIDRRRTRVARTWPLLRLAQRIIAPPFARSRPTRITPPKPPSLLRPARRRSSIE